MDNRTSFVDKEPSVSNWTRSTFFEDLVQVDWLSTLPNMDCTLLWIHIHLTGPNPGAYMNSLLPHRTAGSVGGRGSMGVQTLHPAPRNQPCLQPLQYATALQAENKFRSPRRGRPVDLVTPECTR